MSLLGFDPNKYKTASTAQPKPNEQGRFGDVVDSFQAGAASGLGGIFDFLGADGVAKSLYGIANDQYGQMSSRGQDAMSKQMFQTNAQGETEFGDGMTDLDTWLLQMANVAGQFVPTAVPGAGAAGMATKALSLGSKGAKVAQAISMGATGGSAATGQAMDQARQEVLKMPDKVLADSDLFKRKFLEIDAQSPELDDFAKFSKAKADLAEQVASEVRSDPKSLLANFAASAIGDPVIGRALTGVRLAKSGAFRSALAGGITEGATEATQAGVSQYAVDSALSQIDQRDPMAGVKLAALNEGIIGAGFGAGAGGIGGIANRNMANREPVKNPAADPIRETNPTVAGAMDADAQQAADRRADVDNMAQASQAQQSSQPNYDQPTAARRAGMGDAMNAGRFGDDVIARDNAMKGRSFPTVPGQFNQSPLAQAMDNVQGLTDNRREGEWLPPQGEGRSPVTGLLASPFIDSETLNTQQTREAMAAQPTNIIGKSDTIFGSDGRPMQAAQQFADTTARQTTAQPKQITDKGIIFAPDNFSPQSQGVNVKTNNTPFASAKEALASKNARIAKREGAQVEAVKLDSGFGWRVVPKRDSQNADQAANKEYDGASPEPVTASPVATDAKVQPAKKPDADTPDADTEESPTKRKVLGLAVDEASIDELTISDDVPQFKSGANSNGVVEPLGGKFERTGVAPIQVWVRSDGRKEVISGRHRLDLARRSGEKTIPAQYHYEADGFSQLQAAALDATLNIREGQGKVKDYVDFIQATTPTQEEANAQGLLARATGKRAYSIATKGSDALITAHRNDVITDEAATRIADAAPNNEALQAVGIKSIQEGRSIGVAENMVKAVKSMTSETQQQSGDLFGFDDSAMREAEALARKANSKQSDIQRTLSAVQGAAKRPDLAAKEGVDVKDPKAVNARIEQLKQQKQQWDNWHTNPALVAELKGESFDLAQETEGEREAREAAEAKARKQEEDRRRTEEAKIEADEDLDGFTLTGSNRPADVGAANGQGDIFSQPEPDTTPKNLSVEFKKYERFELENGEIYETMGQIDAGMPDSAMVTVIVDPDQLGEKKRRVSVVELRKLKQAKTELKPAVSANTIFTEDAAEEARKKLRAMLGIVNSGFNPEMMQAGITLAGYHIEKGARTFAAYAKAMMADMGEAVKPYLKSWYMGVKYDPRASAFDGMDSASVVDEFDLGTLDGKNHKTTDTTDTTDTANKPTTEAVKWFGSQAKAQSWIEKQSDPSAYFVKQSSSNRFEVFLRNDYEDDTVEGSPSDLPSASLSPAKLKSLRQTLALKLMGGSEIRDNNDLKAVAALALKMDKSQITQMLLKHAQEAYEVAAMFVRRAEVQKLMNADGFNEAFDYAIKAYDNQPNLDVRTANSSDMQAYSTPLPMALLANIATGIDSNTTVYEPTAGNGLLLPLANRDKVYANELDPARADALAWSGYGVTVRNGADNPLEGMVPEKVDVVIANPPFGKLRDDKGSNITVDFTDEQGRNYRFGELDHVIARAALMAMKPDGKGALILGAPKENGAYTGNNKAFLNWLYSNYHVAKHIEFDGKLYRGQGAAWPTQLIIIHGKAKGGTGRWAPINNEVKRYGDWQAAYNAINSSVDTKRHTYSEGANNGNVLPERTPKPGSSQTAIDSVTGNGNQGDGVRGTDGFTQPTDGGFASGGGKTGAKPKQGTRNAGGKDKLGQANTEPTAKPDGNGNVSRPQPVGLSGVRQPLAPAPKEIPDAVSRSNDFQANYISGSHGFNAEVLTPINIASYTQQALRNIQDIHGSVDSYVANLLEYPTYDDLHAGLMGLQVDAVALALHNIERGRAVIIGDQTGVGKGRQAAALIRYALIKGMTPVFVTQKPNLFTDMFDDAADVGTTLKPLIMNGDAYITKGEDKLFNLSDKKRKDALEHLANTGKMPDEFNALFLTYSQISSDKTGNKTTLLNSIASNALFILDESHTASGQDSKLGKTFQGLVDSAKGVAYLSATYAKRPDNMLLYARTDLGLATDNRDALVEAIKSGGLGMQTYIAGKLAEAGQMVRRERSFKGISINNKVLKDPSANTVQDYDRVTEALRAIQDLSTAWRSYVENELANEIQINTGLDTRVAGNQADTKINITLFSSVVHNYIAQLSLGLKAKQSAQEAIAVIKAGKRPVIALENTMGAALEDYMESRNLKVGDSASALSFGSLLKGVADGVLAYSVKEAGAKKGTNIRVPINEVRNGLVRTLYDDVMRLVDALKVDVPASPIDAIRQEIIDAGYSVEEVTGRDVIVDYGDNAKVKPRPAKEKNRRGVVDRFNSGKTDVLILNQAGSTGLSIHASEKFKDQRQRHMLVAQPSLDINTFMQMLGRVNRTGQVIKPSYDLLWLDLPSEKRPAAVLSRKMSSLNANTSGNTDSATSIESVDMLNIYGDEVVAGYVEENHGMLKRYSEGLVKLPGDDDAMYFLGKLAVMPVEVQTRVLSEIEALYRDHIDYLNATGQNFLNMTELDLDAKPIAQKVIDKGSANAGIFSQPVLLTQVDMKSQSKAPSWQDVQQALADTSQADFDALIHEAEVKGEAYVSEMQRRSAEIKVTIAKLESEGKDTLPMKGRLEELQNDITDFQIGIGAMRNQFGRDGMLSHGAAIMVKLPDNDGVVTGIITGLKYRSDTGNPLAPSKWRIETMLADPTGSLPIPLSKRGELIEGKVHASQQHLESLFNRIHNLPAREKRFIMTGNLVEAVSRSRNKGRIVPFTTHDGRVIQGMLMPKKFNPDGDVKAKSVISIGQAFNWLAQTRDNTLASMGLKTATEDATLRRRRGDYFLEMPKSVSKGKRYWGDPRMTAIIGEQAVKGNGTFEVKLTEAQALKVVAVMEDINPLGVRNDSQVEDANRMFGIKSPGFQEDNILFSKTNSKGKNKGARLFTQAEAQRAVDDVLKRLSGAAGIRVNLFTSQDEFLSRFNVPAMAMEGQTIYGAYDDRRNSAYLILDNFSSIDELRSTLVHEVLAHGGLHTVIGAQKYQQFINKLNSSRSRKEFKELWARIDKDYAGASDAVKAEEVFANFVQNQPERGTAKAWWFELTKWLRRQLEGLGIIKSNATRNEMEDMMQAIVRGFDKRKQRMDRANAVMERGGKQPDSIRYSKAGNITYTPEFKRWFGDSKVVDENGDPLVMYHGTSSIDINEFEGWRGVAGHFAFDPDLANFYANDSYSDAVVEGVSDNAAQVIYPVYLKASNIFDIRKESHRSKVGIKERYGNYETLEQYAKDIYTAEFDAYYDFEDDSNRSDPIGIAVFKKEQIKSATGNNGNFYSSNPDIRFSMAMEEDTRTAKQKLGLEEEAEQTLKEKITENYRNTADTLKQSSFWSRLNEGIFDGLHGIKKAEEAAGITDPNKMGYVSARLASGLSDVLHGVFHYGAPMWKDGIIQRKADTKGLLEVFGMLPDGELNNWLAWMGANRAKQLKAAGRENNLSQADIDELLALADGKEKLFEEVRAEYNKINSAVLDVAQGAGLISEAQRSGFDEEYYVPFFREQDVDPEMQDIASMVTAPFTKKGIAGQSAKIKALKGGKQSTKDLLENIILRQSTMLDAALKNKAMLEVADNLDGTQFMTQVDSPEFAKLSQRELNSIQRVKVMRDGQAVAYAVTDPALLRGLIAVNDVGSQALFNRMGRSAKRFLTAGVTLSPDFIFKNFIRDAAHAWMINKDDFKFGTDSIKGLKKAFKEDEAYRDLIFSGAAFQGGYVHGADPEAAAQQIRRALSKKGLSDKQINSYMGTLVTSGKALIEKYRNASDKVENANRLSTYEAALAKGKSRRQAAFEAKDLMDYAMKGNFALISTMIDFLPFFNARLQGMYKLARASAAGDNDKMLKVLSANLAMKGLKVAAFSLALAAMNDDDERYQELPDWDKDANWHFWLGDDHFRIPKPFELGVIFGTLPERLLGFGTGSQTGSDLGRATAHAVFNTMALNPIPQIALPVVEVMTNKSFFKDAPIEGMGDEQRMPGDRYNAYTSDIARELGQLFNVSPKKIEHLVNGYAGTLGGYVLAMSDMMARQMLGIEKAETPISRYPVVKAFYGGDAPKGNTYYQNEFYKALDAANQAYGSYKRAAEEQDSSRIMDVLEANRDKLGVRIALNRVQRQVSALSKQAEMVNNSSMGPSEKREKLDAITRQKNAIYQRAYIGFNLREW